MNKKGTKALASATLMSLVLTTALATGNVKAAAGQVTRVGGVGRYETAAKVATANFTTSENVVLVSGEGYADSVSASVLAKKLNAPIVLTGSKTLDANAKSAIETLKAKNVYIIGGTGSISQSIQDGLESDYTVTRLGGQDRYATNLAIANKLVDLGVSKDNIIAVAGTGFADALSVAPVAATDNEILLLTNNNADTMKNTAEFAKDSNVTVVGTTNVVSDSIYNQLKADKRIKGGADRFETNINVLKAFDSDLKADKLYVANATQANPDNLYADALVASAIAGKYSAPLVLVDKDGSTGTNNAVDYIGTKATKTTDLQVVGGAGVVSDNTVNAINDKVNPPVTDLKVDSVSAINAKQIQVAFNAPVDKTTATDVANYSLKVATGSKIALSSTTATADLSSDKKTVTITLTNPLTNDSNVFGSALSNGDSFQVTVGTGVKDAEGTNLAAESTTTVAYSDTTAPTLVSATSTAKTSTNTVKLTFSEPVDTTAATATINGSAAIVSTPSATTPNEVTLTSSSPLTAGTSYNVSLLNFKDAAGNLTTTNPITTTVNVVSDTTAPAVSSVTPVNNSSVEVTFSKDMDASTITTGSLRLLDSNLTSTGIAVSGVAPKVIDGVNSKTTFVITLTGLPYNSSNTFNGVVSYTSNIKDLSGNALAAGTTPVTLTKDTTAPSYVSASYKKVSTYNGVSTPNGAIVVKYSEPVTANVSATYTIVDDQGASLSTPITTPAINPNDDTELILPLTNTVATTAKTYTVVLPSGAVRDNSIEVNPSASANTTVDVSTGAPVASDTDAPTVAFNDVTPATNQTSGTTFALNIVDVGAAGLDLATVTNTSNYKLDGAALPAGSYVTFASGIATIHIPAGAIAEDKTYSLNVNGIKDKAGNTADPFVNTTDIALVSDTQPVLKTGVLNSNGTISLGFSKDVNGVAGTNGATTAADFTVKANGTSVPVSDLIFADGTGSDSGKYVVSIQANVDAGADANAATTADNRVYIDVNGDTTYTAGTDILVSTGTTKTFGTPFTLDANLLSTLSIEASDATTVTDTKTLSNPLKTGTVITVK